jgi:hypothetical protein
MGAAGRHFVGAACVSGVQVALMSSVVALWRYTAERWSEAVYLCYFLAFLVIIPLFAFSLGRRVAMRPRPLALWRAWPISVGNAIAVFGAHGFEDAGVGVAAMLVGYASLSLIAGWAALQPVGLE